MHSHLKKPALAMPSTIIIIPAIKIMVAQFIPEVLSEDSPALYQNSVVKMFCRLSVSQNASKLRKHNPNTITAVARPLPSVM